MKSIAPTGRDAVLRQLEAALRLLSDCPERQIPSALLETALFLVGTATSPESPDAELFSCLTRLEESIAAYVARARGREPTLPDVGHAAADFAAERQKADDLRRQMETLSKRRSELRRELEAYSPEQREQAEKIAVMERQLTLLRDNLTACRADQEQLNAWFRTTSSPLDAMAELLDEPDFSTLRRTLDPAALGTYRTLRGEIEQRLDKMNVLLAQCGKAVQRDQQALEKKVEAS